MIGPIGGIAPFLGGVVCYLLAISKDNGDNGAMFVVFGRPGAGKSTVADLAVEKLNSNSNDNDNDNNNNIVLGLDLDVCVPDWMKDNFSRGIYPTLQQRIEFAENACDYVAKKQKKHQYSSSSAPAPAQELMISVISFSFVNTDLRDVFRSRFPNADWILIDTKPNEANKRIQQRQDHFYNQKTCNTDDDDNANDSSEGDTTSSGDDDDTIVNEIDPDNEDWNFAPVTFPHIILDGDDEIETNAQKIVNLIQEKQKTLS